jgi:lysyl-tRNA synthetase class 2
MNFVVDDAVKAAFPCQVTGMIGPVDVTLCEIPPIVAELRRKVESIKSAPSLEALSAIVCWRNVYRSMGASPKHHSSLESLAICLRERGDLWQIHPLVDLYNWVSLVCQVPMAAYDVSKIYGTVALRYAKKGEAFVPLGNPHQIEKTKGSEIVYADEGKIICRYWNCRDCEETKITPATRRVVFFLDLSRGLEENFDIVFSKAANYLAAGLGVSVQHFQLI